MAKAGCKSPDAPSWRRLRRETRLTPVSGPQRTRRLQAEPDLEPDEARALTPEELEGLYEGFAAVECGETFSREQAAAYLNAHLPASSNDALRPPRRWAAISCCVIR